MGWSQIVEGFTGRADLDFMVFVNGVSGVIALCWREP